MALFDDALWRASVAFGRMHSDLTDERLALLAGRTPGVDGRIAVAQSAGRRIATEKLPHWSEIDDIIYPPHTPMEQCSSADTAFYKATLVTGDSLTDLTGGLGVDFSAMAQGCKRATYVERDETLCQLARHNLPLLGLHRAIVVHADAVDYVQQMPPIDTIFIDPARRDSHGRRTYAIADCSPDVSSLAPSLLQKARRIIVKLSPMLDISATLSALPSVSALHIVGTSGECKELVVVMDRGHEGPATVVCHMMGQPEVVFEVGRTYPVVPLWNGVIDNDGSLSVYIPNATIMKGGCFGALWEMYPHLQAIGKMSHIFVGPALQLSGSFPGRCLTLHDITSLNKTEVRHKLGGVQRANVSVRNFPLTAPQLSQRLGMADGGDLHLIGTTLFDGRRVVLICSSSASHQPGNVNTQDVI